MYPNLTTINVRKLKGKLGRVLIACRAAMELGDCKAVARLTCEAARLRDWISLADSMRLAAA
jgi:hypothetical protein